MNDSQIAGRWKPFSLLQLTLSIARPCSGNSFSVPAPAHHPRRASCRSSRRVSPTWAQHASLSHLQALQRLDHGDGSFFPCHQTLSLRHDQHAGLYQDNMFCYVSGGEMMKSVPVPIWGILALVPDPSKLFSQIRNRNFKTWIRTANCCQSFYEHDH